MTAADRARILEAARALPPIERLRLARDVAQLLPRARVHVTVHVDGDADLVACAPGAIETYDGLRYSYDPEDGGISVLGLAPRMPSDEGVAA